MKKIVILISHIPNPRILKRIKTLENNFKITLIYWDRGLANKETFEINSKHKVQKIEVKAPLGNPVKRIIPLIKYMFKAIGVLKCEKPNIIHAGNLDMLFIASLYKKIFNRNVKIVYEVGDLPKYTFVKKVKSLKDIVSKVIHRLEVRLTSNISIIILTSPYFWDEYYSKFIDNDKYLFIPNAPYKSLFDKYKKQHNDIFTIGFIGSVRYVKQLKMLIDAVDELNIDIKVFIAGGGPGYEEIVKYSKNKTFVEIYGPYNYEKEIVSLYEKIDCVYSVYDTDIQNVRIALPNRLYEAIVCSIPIIGAKGTVLGKFIEENQIGFTVNSSDKEELKEVLLTLANSKELVDLFVKNFDKIKDSYYYENNSERLLKEYIKIIM